MKNKPLLKSLHFTLLAIISGCLTVPFLVHLSKYMAVIRTNEVVRYFVGLLGFTSIVVILAKITRLK